MDKRRRATLFRSRLQAALDASGLTQAALARAAGVDRSTVSQLLAPGAVRLPNAQVAADCAAALGVSCDWLLGLSDRRDGGAEVAGASVTLTAAPRALVDERMFAWHQEAEGYKIRHVPAGLPDMLKTEAMLRWESGPSMGRSAEQAIGASRDRLDRMRRARSDYEIALPLHELASFARAEGFYAGLPLALRREQMRHMRELHEQLYPTLRVHLYDGRRAFSAPLTVFGPLLAVIYLGHNYLAFRDTERVDAMAGHFDALVREAVVGSRDFARHLHRLGA